MNNAFDTIFELIIICIAYRLGKFFMTNKNEEIDYLARTMWGEARGEGAQGMQAVGNVIMNRVKAGTWYGATIKEVVLKPYQFSAWNSNDPNRAKMLSATEKELKTAKDIAVKLYNGELPDITNGATNYHAKNVSPSWANKMVKTAVIGNHIFYREV